MTGPSASGASARGDRPTSILLVFPAAYLLHHYLGTPLAIVGLLCAWLFLHVYFRLVPPAFSAMFSGAGAAALYGAAAYVWGINAYVAVIIAAMLYPPGYVAGVIAAQSLYKDRL